MGLSYRNIIVFLLVISGNCLAKSNIDDMDLTQLREALDSGSVTSQELVQHYTNKINDDNHQGKKINAVTAINPEALQEAKKWDEEHRKKTNKNSTSLAGIPFLVKDNYDTLGLATTGGVEILRQSMPVNNAFIVQKLIDDGAIMLGKTNMSELAASYGWLGYSSYGGQTLNPLNLKRDASGSSSGSAAAVAAGFAPFALGTDTGGSVRGPASVTGLVGLRPTLGLTSRSGVIPLSLTFDTTGVLTKSVPDQVTVLNVIQGSDTADAATQGISQRNPLIAKFDGTTKGKTVGVIDNFLGGNEEVDAILKKSEQKLKDAGIKVIHISLPNTYENLWNTVLGPVGDAEFKPQFERYLATLQPAYNMNLSEFIKRINEYEKTSSSHKMNPKRFNSLVAAEKNDLTDTPLYIDILSRTIPALRQQLSTIMDENGVDVLLFSTMSCPASTIHTEKDNTYICHSDDPYAASYISSATGFPEITVPGGFISGNNSVGISFLAKSGEDQKVISYADFLQSLN